MADILDFQPKADKKMQSAIEQRINEVIQTCQYILSDELLNEEFERQLAQWGVNEHDATGWLSFLTEEVGEVAKAINQGKPQDAVLEIIQVISMSLQLARYLATHSVYPATGQLSTIDEFFERVEVMYAARGEKS